MQRITIWSTVVGLSTICFFILIASDKGCDECFSPPVMLWKIALCGLVWIIGGIYNTRRYLHTEKHIFHQESLPLLDSNEAVDGLPFSGELFIDKNEDRIVYSPYTQKPCVYYHSITEHYVKSGKSGRWVIDENLVHGVPFYVSDAYGKVKIEPANLDSDLSGYDLDNKNPKVPDPDGSEFDCVPVLVRHPVKTGTLSDMLFSPRKRRSEYILCTDIPVFVTGFVHKIGNETVLREHPEYPLIISRKTKDLYVEEYYKGRNLVYAVFAFLSVGFSAITIALGYLLKISTSQMLTALTVIQGLLGIWLLATIYNRMMTLRYRAEFALNNIDIELKRRSELIPKLVVVVKSFSKYEKEIQEWEVKNRMRAVFSSSADVLPQNKIPTLSAIVEQYPDLKASENFRMLVKSLVDTEERIAYARTFYNRNVRKLNNLIGQFPFNIVSIACSIEPKQFLSLTS